MGVPARLCSHLREMTGLTIRAAVSQPGCATYPHWLSHVGQVLYLSPNFRRPIPLWRPRPQSVMDPSPSSQRLATTTALRPPAVADRSSLPLLLYAFAPRSVHSLVITEPLLLRVTKPNVFQSLDKLQLIALARCSLPTRVQIPARQLVALGFMSAAPSAGSNRRRSWSRPVELLRPLANLTLVYSLQVFLTKAEDSAR
jgi:hypothetical protein